MEATNTGWLPELVSFKPDQGSNGNYKPMKHFNTTRGALHTGGLHWRAPAPGEVTAAAGSQRGCRFTDNVDRAIAVACPATVGRQRFQIGSQIDSQDEKNEKYEFLPIAGVTQQNRKLVRLF